MRQRQRLPILEAIYLAALSSGSGSQPFVERRYRSVDLHPKGEVRDQVRAVRVALRLLPDDA